MPITTAKDLLELPVGTLVASKEMYDLVQYSKVAGSPSWLDDSYSIGNTPQQGINWIGSPPAIRAVLIKTKAGAYAEDGWIDAAATRFRYSYKAQKGVISLRDKANLVLARQPELGYPVLLFIREKDALRLSGRFEVAALEERSVVLRRSTGREADDLPQDDLLLDNPLFLEGYRRYVTHFLAERNKAVIDLAKKSRPWICEVCREDYKSKYGVAYIEAHHKTPIETFEDEHAVRASDLALLCPNCHKAVHLYMRSGHTDFEKLCGMLREGLRAWKSKGGSS